MHGVVIAGTHSGCGKTIMTLGILAALREKGYKVQAFKAGPDFIDSGLHKLVTEKPSRNLDLWMCGGDYVVECFRRQSADVDVAVIEGVMGLYDGKPSTAELAGLLGLPVILVVDAYGMAESAGAVVRGFYEDTRCKMQNAKLMGVIFNRVASERHYERLKRGVRDIPVLGYLPRDLRFRIPERHLGLMVAEEAPISQENIQRLADTVLKYIDIDWITRCRIQDWKNHASCIMHRESLTHPICIAVAYDKAFCFYYEDNLDLLRSSAEIVLFSPLSDEGVPHRADVIYIGGGYPELYAPLLSKNESMLRSIHAWAKSGKPIYAECGGLMYLSKGIYYNPPTPFNKGEYYAMAGVFPFETQIPPYPPLLKGCRGGLRPHLGYREILLKEDCILGKEGDKLRGHEFHYSEIISKPLSLPTSYSVKNGLGRDIGDEGYRIKNTLASYIHIHFGSNPHITRNFINFLKEG